MAGLLVSSALSAAATITSSARSSCFRIGGEGLGKAVVEATVASLDPGSDVFLATTSAAPFFARIGFSEVRRDSVPAAVLATRQLSSICPSSATIMRLTRPPT
jgi:N-acetylglutamate synthase-like GNAT family acetyltransferase